MITVLVTESGQAVYKILKDGGLKETTARDFGNLLDHLEFDKVNAELFGKFMSKGILQYKKRKYKIEMEDPNSCLEWVLMALTYEGLLERKCSKTRQKRSNVK